MKALKRGYGKTGPCGPVPRAAVFPKRHGSATHSGVRLDAVGRRISSFADLAELIERFLDGQSRYPQEWNDFVEVSLRDETAERYRERCHELDPLVNCPGEQDQNAVSELRQMVRELRLRSGSGQQPTTS